jgi:hypothetical protein
MAIDNSSLLPFTNPITGSSSGTSSGAAGTDRMQWLTGFNAFSSGAANSFATIWNALKGNTPTINVNNPGTTAPATQGGSNMTIWIIIIVVVVLAMFAFLIMNRK